MCVYKYIHIYVCVGVLLTRKAKWGTACRALLSKPFTPSLIYAIISCPQSVSAQLLFITCLIQNQVSASHHVCYAISALSHELLHLHHVGWMDVNAV